MNLFSRFRVARLAMLTTLAVGAVGITLGSGCVQDQDYLVVERAVWFDDPASCTLSDDVTPLTMPVDVSFASQIAMGFLITNNQSPNANSNSGIDDSEIQIQTADVSLSFSGGGVSGGSFTVTLPSNSILGGESEAFLVRIPHEVGDSLRATMQGLPESTYETLEMEVVFHGRRTGQAGGTKLGSVKTAPYVYPFDVCLGCLSYCQTAEACNTPELCPTEAEWRGVCGYAQGARVVHSECASPDE
jgi:hypothetical protein